MDFYPEENTETPASIKAIVKKSLLIPSFFFLYAGYCAAQGITINPRASLVMNGNITLVLNNAPLKNDGSFVASTSTVMFSGPTDSLASYVDGTVPTTFHNLSITKSANGVALKSPVGVRNVLAVTGGNLYTDSNLTLLSDAALTARVDVVPVTSEIIGKAFVQRYVPARRAWRLMTAPVTSSNTIYNTWQNGGVYTPGVGMLVTGPNPTGVAGNGLDQSYQNNTSMKMWNSTTQAFTSISNTHVPISPGCTGNSDNAGYFVFVRGDRDPKNTTIPYTNITTLTSIGSLQTGTQSFKAASKGNSYTLVGNPYASPIDFNNVSLNNLVKRFYVWDPRINVLGGYVVLDDLDNDGVYTSTVAASAQTKEIQSSQAFFVETKVDGPASITFDESCKSGGNNNLVFRPLRPNTPAGSGTGQVRASLHLEQADSSTILADGVLAEFNDIFSLQVDRDDALKFWNVNENLGIQRYTSILSAERRPALTDADTIFFNISRMAQKNYQLQFAVTGFAQTTLVGMLEDSYLKTSSPVNLSGTTIARFNVDGNAASYAAGRFRLVFKDMAPLPVLLTNVEAFEKEDGIAVQWKVANEINILRYEIEQSLDGATFKKAGSVDVTGTNNKYNSYSWLDVNPVHGNNFYRVKIIERSGASKYSSIVKVAIAGGNGTYVIYPNPVKGGLINLHVNNQPAGAYQVKLTNSLGQVLYTGGYRHAGANSVQTLNAGSNLPAGIYQLEIAGAGESRESKEVVIE